uniref:Snake toxin/toxin-like domain-containing protein n=1 Tax=Bubo bubo TaxID=30461 RepID=A0A8C0ECW4_BUBBB
QAWWHFVSIFHILCLLLNWRCLKAEKCSDKDEYCVTNVASVGIGMCSLSFWKRITKKCSETCPHHNFMLGLASYTSYCCQTFLCNLSASAVLVIPFIVLPRLLVAVRAKWP